MPVQEEWRLSDYEAEQIVIAGLLRAPDLNANRVRSILRDHDFCWVHHAWLYRRCLDIWRDYRGVPIRIDYIAKEIAGLHGRRIHRRDFGSNFAVTIHEIYESDPTGMWCLWKARRVAELAERRRVIHAARVRIRDALNVV